MTLDDLRFLTSPRGERLLERLAAEDLADAHTLKLLMALRKDHTADEARAGLELARLRARAVEKFGGGARRLFFTREALEQASDPLCRRYRAGQMSAAARHVVDACCGIGADSLAFAAAGLAVHGLDVDPVRVEIARLNAAALGLAARFEAADARAPLPEADAVFFDPARRDDTGQRVFDVEQYAPPLSTLLGWSHPLVVAKLSPGVELAQVTGYGGVEFVSVGGALKEAVLWRGAGSGGLDAVLLDGSAVYRWERREQAFGVDAPGLSLPRGWLVEPDPALIRAGLVQDAAARFGGALLDDSIAYFTADERPATPWARAWKILDWMPFNLKKLRVYLNQRGVGRVTVKKRGSAVTPETLIAQLRLKGDEPCVVVLTRCRGQQIALICEDYEPAG